MLAMFTYALNIFCIPFIFNKGLGVFLLTNQIKVPLKAKILQLLFSQMHQNYAKFYSWWK
jgi:hypothetical protein